MNPRKHKTGRAELSAAGARLPVLEDGKPPGEFQIFRAGTNESDYGPILFDEVAARLVMDSRTEKGNPLYFDLNHGMLRPNASRDDGKSYGEFDIEVRAGALWAINCMWTQDGAALVAKREYNLFSPAFQWFDDETGTRRPYELINCALVNLAGLDNIRPLAAGADLNTDDGGHMDPKELQAALDKANAIIATQTNEIASLKARDASRGTAALAGALALPPTATVEEQVAAATGLAKLNADICQLTAQTTTPAAIGVIRSWQESHAQVAKLSAQIEGEKKVERTKSFTALLDKAVTDKLIAPSFRKDFWEKQHVVEGHATAQGLEMLTAFIGSKPAPAVGDQVTQPATGVLSTAVGAQLSRTMNVDEAEFLKFQAEKAIRANAAG